MLYLLKLFLGALQNLKHNRRLFDIFLVSLFSTLKKKALSEYFFAVLLTTLDLELVRNFRILQSFSVN